jgi:hypothetical protein
LVLVQICACKQGLNYAISLCCCGVNKLKLPRGVLPLVFCKQNRIRHLHNLPNILSIEKLVHGRFLGRGAKGSLVGFREFP